VKRNNEAMAKKKVADLLVDTLVAANVERVYGISGDSLNAITDSIRRHGQIRWIHVRHEETAAFAAGAELNFGIGGGNSLWQLRAICVQKCENGF